jgi:ATP-dependent DNA helicase HFM1/MER3
MAASAGQLRVSDVVSAEFLSIFPFEYFNAMQSIVARQLLETPLNVVVAAPTGSGKTVLHELAIVRLLMTQTQASKKLKAVVIAPNKALCQQRVSMWSKSFGQVGLTVIELTGDSTISQGLRSIVTTNIIVTTPVCRENNFLLLYYLLWHVDIIIFLY